MLVELTNTFQTIETDKLIGVLLLGTFCLIYYYISSPRHSLPLLNPQKPSEIRYIHARRRFLSDARSLIKSGLSKFPAFSINTENGPKIVLAPEYANEVRGHPSLSFGLMVERDFHTGISGFEPFEQASTSEQILQDAIRMKLTQSLGNVTKPLSDETNIVLQKHWSDDTEWHSIPLKSTILKIVAQLSSRVFLGDEVCRNPAWLQVTINFTVNAFFAAEELRLWPKFTRPWVAGFLSSVQKIRADLKEARRIIIPVLEKRKAEKQAALKEGKTPERYTDAMEWMEECAKGRSYDAPVAQLSLSVAAIHTTSDMITQVLYDLCGRDELVDALREEIITVVREEGWKKTTLYKLKLMDSVLKESQRLKPITITGMRRLATKGTKFSDGTFIPKGSVVIVSSERMWDPSFYPDPETFDPYRFLKLREVSGHETSSQLVSPSPEHLGFGLGKHACPGRFFAANEIKIALCHILLKYDFRLAPGSSGKPPVRKNGLSLNADSQTKIEIRRRKEELVL
ncbi:hypothetical protein AJ80_06875 [Polytolypa hystricis UAMH7299]|uniref:Cytochrome P450 monooxygenase n=1 Tax=Polytolypa hystricis (strain UAMH7299) TaxID=1447883 RepID=A0A2B7XS55_POLH7|nr:hypothetical protein AJ80_06875 [Polytolypa hystricis UAMH7299]